MAQLIKVAEIKELVGKNAIVVETTGQKIALFKVDGKYYAIGDTCTHRGGPLSEGTLEGILVTCPWHGAKFDVTTGKVARSPARADVPCYNVVVEGDDINVEIPT